MTVTLTNHLRRMLVFVLPHEQYCERLGRCVCTEISGHNPRRFPDSLTLPALSTLDVEDAVLAVTDVQNAIRKGDVTATAKPKGAGDVTTPSESLGSVPAVSAPTESTPDAGGTAELDPLGEPEPTLTRPPADLQPSSTERKRRART
jgi:hypothetical protein